MEYLYHCTVPELRRAEGRRVKEALADSELTVLNCHNPITRNATARIGTLETAPCPHCGAELTRINLYRHVRNLHNAAYSNKRQKTAVPPASPLEAEAQEVPQEV